MMIWLLACTKPIEHHEAFLCDAFVEQAQWPVEQDGLLHVVVDHKTSMTHQITTPTSLTLDVLLLEREELRRGAFDRTHYQYRLTGDKGSHIIEPLEITFQAEQSHSVELTEIFVDIGLEEHEMNLHEILKRPQRDYSLPVWLFVFSGVGFFWYQRRKKNQVIPSATLEEEIRSLWHEICLKEGSVEHASKLMSHLLKRYLGMRYKVSLVALGPQELRQWIRESNLRSSAQEAALRIVDTITQAQFDDTEIDRSILAVLGRDLEVVMVRSEHR